MRGDVRDDGRRRRIAELRADEQLGLERAGREGEADLRVGHDLPLVLRVLARVAVDIAPAGQRRLVERASPPEVVARDVWKHDVPSEARVESVLK